jgi:carboxyl-terminal processing protease
VGDRVVDIEGKPIAHFANLGEAIMVMRGPEGTTVRFTVDDGGERRPLELTREIVDAPAVEVRALGDGIGVLRLRDFQEASAREVRRGLRELAGGEEELRGVVLDLRDNGGGLLQQAIEVVNLFVERGAIVRTRGRHGELLDQAFATPGGTRGSLPLVVLINKASASASEIVAGALQDHRRALIVGERSYGKGSVQTPFRLRDGSILKLTVALYYTPDDRLIQASGIKPDVRVARTRAEYEDGLPGLEPERASPRHLRPEDFGAPPVEGPQSQSESASERESTGDEPDAPDAPDQAPVRLADEELPPAVRAAGDDAQLAAAVEHLLAWDRIVPARRARKSRR